jgi:uncharacterized membrane protein
MDSMTQKIAPYFLLAFAVLGFLDATYLTIQHYNHVIPPCTLLHGCEQVLTSQFATVVGIPVALFGALYYAIIFLGVLVYTQIKSERLLRLLSWFTFTGFAASVWFVYLQAFVLHNFCQFCLGSAITSTALFITGLAVLLKRKTLTLPVQNI